MKFSTKYPHLKPIAAYPLEERKKIIIDLINHVRLTSLRKYSKRFDTERYAHMAITAQEQNGYQRIEQSCNALINRVHQIYDLPALEFYITPILFQYKPPEIMPDVPKMFFETLVGNLNKYYQ